MVNTKMCNKIDLINLPHIIKNALERMDRHYCELSKLTYSMEKLGLNEPIIKKLKEAKYLERPIAYEFYHQFRKMIENSEVDMGGHVIQAEVDKRYQSCFERGIIPDFILHIKDTSINLAVIEFKMASNIQNISNDLKKLILFKERLNYSYLMEIIIGRKEELEETVKRTREIIKNIIFLILGPYNFSIKSYRGTKLPISKLNNFLRKNNLMDKINNTLERQYKNGDLLARIVKMTLENRRYTIGEKCTLIKTGY